ncbi:hypothetical protein B0H16DRAFT_1305173 [Mycena metata]|uniref:Uncharacterized protein n=1 Tax=Mycena metata TaxID=1033252 RepID=A0AAD7JYH3_9AGAR|nr:hypothetical protein B0H16DRAFT_1305173 [Mycena metata]
MLAYGDSEFLLEFFRHWDPATILLLGGLNYRLLNIVRFYQAAVWNVSKFLSRWFFHPDKALATLHSSPAIACGPSVLQFFDRSARGAARLDICVGYEGISEIGKFLDEEGYFFRPGPLPGTKNFASATMVEATRLPEARLKVYGDRSFTQEEHAGHAFKFVRFERRRPSRVIVVHLVRCELHRYVLSMHSTALMNFICGTHAVSLFGRSAFIRRKTFVACQERLPISDESIRTEMEWIEDYAGGPGPFRVLGAVVEVDVDAEVGSRRVGDSRCWTLPSIPTDGPFDTNSRINGPAFDALDWKSGTTRHGSYMRIGEPFVWRCGSYDPRLTLSHSQSRTYWPLNNKTTQTSNRTMTAWSGSGCPSSATTDLQVHAFARLATLTGLVEQLRRAPTSERNSRSTEPRRSFYLMATACSTAVPIFATTRKDYLDLYLPFLFPNGYTSMRIANIPGTNMPLPSGWRIYVESGRYPSPPNEAIMTAFKTRWNGNILMVKHRRNSDLVNYVTRKEDDFAYTILSLWVPRSLHKSYPEKMMSSPGGL